MVLLRHRMLISKDGVLGGNLMRPSFETHRLRDAPQDEVREHTDMIRTRETLTKRPVG